MGFTFSAKNCENNAKEKRGFSGNSIDYLDGKERNSSGQIVAIFPASQWAMSAP
jgi:hypothetical protein